MPGLQSHLVSHCTTPECSLSPIYNCSPEAKMLQGILVGLRRAPSPWHIIARHAGILRPLLLDVR